MSLKAIYKNPEVILTTEIDARHQKVTKAIRVLAILMITLYLVYFSFSESLLLSLSTLILTTGLVLSVMARPKVILNSIKNKVEVFGVRDASQKKEFQPNQIAKILVRTKKVKSSKGLFDKNHGSKKKNHWYVAQIHTKPAKALGKTTAIDCFELEDMIEAHYMALIIATFSKVTAYDVHGKPMEPLKSHIPTRYTA